jgi:hypothetical protein
VRGGQRPEKLRDDRSGETGGNLAGPHSIQRFHLLDSLQIEAQPHRSPGGRGVFEDMLGQEAVRWADPAKLFCQDSFHRLAIHSHERVGLELHVVRSPFHDLALAQA